ncbi:MAG: cysteine--tRNA ligase [Candidatus Dojkabacteria bacterium]
MALKLYNTLTRQLEEVTPYKPGEITMYNCGPTVYSRQHIGNYRAFAEWDILHRALLYLGYKVNRVTNITDVGHMSSDEDFGEDKMEKQAGKEGKQPIEIADEIIKTFMQDVAALNYLNPDGTAVDPKIDPKKVGEHNWTRATDYIEQMIKTVQSIEKAGYTYETEQAIYFDVTKYADYTALSKQNLNEKEVGVRDEVNVDPDKKHPADFVLWMKAVGHYANHIMRWESPWGVGFPGWHIECSAMGCDKLGEHIDIHTGGIEHIGVHHTNERAQNFGAFGHEVVKMWVHNEHLIAKDGGKMAKSLGNIYTVPQLVEMGYAPLDLRYYYLTAKYRQPLYFSLEGLDGAKNARHSLVTKLWEVNQKADGGKGEILKEYKQQFIEALEDDLNKPKALAVVAELLKAESKPEDIIATLLDFDQVLGLNLKSTLDDQVPAEVNQLLNKRKAARESKDFALSDKLREEIESLGYTVKDSSDGVQTLVKK